MLESCNGCDAVDQRLDDDGYCPTCVTERAPSGWTTIEADTDCALGHTYFDNVCVRCGATPFWQHTKANDAA